MNLLCMVLNVVTNLLTMSGQQNQIKQTAPEQHNQEHGDELTPTAAHLQQGQDRRDSNDQNEGPRHENLPAKKQWTNAMLEHEAPLSF